MRYGSFAMITLRHAYTQLHCDSAWLNSLWSARSRHKTPMHFVHKQALRMQL